MGSQSKDEVAECFQNPRSQLLKCTDVNVKWK